MIEQHRNADFGFELTCADTEMRNKFAPSIMSENPSPAAWEAEKLYPHIQQMSWAYLVCITIPPTSCDIWMKWMCVLAHELYPPSSHRLKRGVISSSKHPNDSPDRRTLFSDPL